MPIINVKLIEDVFTPDQKREIIERLTDAMVSIVAVRRRIGGGSRIRTCVG